MTDLARVRRAAEMLGTVRYLLDVRELDSALPAYRRTSEMYLQVRRIAGEAQSAIEEEIEPLAARGLLLEALLRNWLADVDEALDDDPGSHDAAVRIGARWDDGDYSRRFKDALNG